MGCQSAEADLKVVYSCFAQSYVESDIAESECSAQPSQCALQKILRDRPMRHVDAFRISASWLLTIRCNFFGALLAGLHAVTRELAMLTSCESQSSSSLALLVSACVLLPFTSASAQHAGHAVTGQEHLGNVHFPACNPAQQQFDCAVLSFAPTPT